MTFPAPPSRSFASDNAAGAHPAVIEAIARVNVGHALAYGDDDETRACERRFDELFGREVATFLTFNGTGANIVALTALVRPGDAVVCSDWAHVNVDETGAPERVVGAKLIDLPTTDGKLTAAQVDEQAHALDDFHHAQPAVVSITQSTELGTLYTPEEIKDIADHAHSLGMRVHLDGARISNAAAALDLPFRAFTRDVGVDVLSFGGTKNGALGAEAIVLFGAARARFGELQARAKRAGHMPAKARYMAAQMEAYLQDGLWLKLAAHANAMAKALSTVLVALPGAAIVHPVDGNEVFARLPEPLAERLASAGVRFHRWEGDVHRFVCSWSTTQDEIEGVAAAGA